MPQKKAQTTVYLAHQELIRKILANINALLALLENIQVMEQHFAKNVYQEHAQINYMVQLLV